jgi:predicted SAM-dependent methyltransferase
MWEIAVMFTTLPVQSDRQVDLAACLLGTFQHMLTQEDAKRALQRIHAALKPGGIFVLEMNHPSLLFDGSITSSADTWKLDLEEAQVEVWWGHEGDIFDPLTQILTKTIEVDMMSKGGERQKLFDTVELRQYTFQELKLLAENAGFEVICFFTSI